MPDRAILTTENDFEYLKVVLAGLYHINAGEFSSSFQRLILWFTHLNLMNAIGEEVGVENRVWAEQEAMQACLIDLEIFNLTVV